MKKLHVIFDLDGTLANSFGPVATAFLAIADRAGLPCDEQVRSRLAENYGLPVTELLNVCWPGADHEIFERSLRGQDLSDRIPLFPSAKAVLSALDRDGIGMSIFTDRRRDDAFSALKSLAIDNFFVSVVTRDDVVNGKPDPAGLKRIADPLLANGMARASLIYIGDSGADYACARQANIDFVAVTETANASRERFLALGLPDDRILSRLRDLPAWLEIE